MKNEKIIITYSLIFIVLFIMYKILIFEVFRGIIEIGLAVASFVAYKRSENEMIQNVTMIAMVVLFFMGIYDISIGIGWIQ
ncbi:hypothetical protein KAU33_09355 [Candidatus Dependentiae bacterium]|nr:hypothetical protein [Candidatus Dependentiae bacterium]